MATKKTTKAQKNAALGLARCLASAFGGKAVATKNGAAVVLKRR